jgi:uncharacterized membrane protein YhaH (DUF805 family)
MFEAYKRYADFTGRASRSEYWLFALFILLAALGLAAIDQVLVLIGARAVALLPAALYVILLLGSLVPSVAVTFRRLHDIDRSAWWLLISFVPFIGAIVLLVFYCLPGTPGPNRFGPPPAGTPGVLQETFA